jgi:hypothetical protein
MTTSKTNSRSKHTPKNRRPAQSAPPSDIVGQACSAGPELPSWFPAQTTVLGLSSTARQGLEAMIAAAYRDFVLHAETQLERTVGNSLVFLLWLELFNQIRLAPCLADRNSPEAILEHPDLLVDRCLELTGVKCQAVALMLKIRMGHQAMNRLAALSPDLTAQTHPFSLSLDNPKLEIRHPVGQLPPLHGSAELEDPETVDQNFAAVKS